MRPGQVGNQAALSSRLGARASGQAARLFLTEAGGTAGRGPPTRRWPARSAKLRDRPTTDGSCFGRYREETRMPYQVLARKWRPQTFAEVVGQEHISRTLTNAIRQNRIGHAYLFVGSRGIGKTTTARIFAKALNCLNNQDGEPCCKCECCIEAANGASLDIIEIDGASHNKVEDVRDIRENVQYAPSRGKYKIYIIDEVHMLTTQAWNAPLKHSKNRRRMKSSRDDRTAQNLR